MKPQTIIFKPSDLPSYMFAPGVPLVLPPATVPDPQFGKIQNPAYNPAVNPYVFPGVDLNFQGNYVSVTLQATVTAAATFLIEGFGVNKPSENAPAGCDPFRIVRSETVSVGAGANQVSMSDILWTRITGITLLTPGVVCTAFSCSPFLLSGAAEVASYVLMGPIFPDLNVASGDMSFTFRTVNWPDAVPSVANISLCSSLGLSPSLMMEAGNGFVLSYAEFADQISLGVVIQGGGGSGGYWMFIPEFDKYTSTCADSVFIFTVGQQGSGY